MSEQKSPQTKTPKISAIIPIRDRSGDRLNNCLRSLRWQEGVMAHSIEIIIVDFGSSAEHQKKIEASATQFSAYIVRIEAGGLWNRSRALNCGIKSASGEYLFCTDVDMIFAPNFISEMINVHDQMAHKSIVFSRCKDLPETVPMQPYQRSDYLALETKGVERATQGTGACQSAHRDFFFNVRGYDEAFEHWGAEDDDLRSRAIRYGLQPRWISPQTSMLHQWHPTTKNQYPWRKRMNKARLYLTRWKIKKNPTGWGEGA